MRNYYRTIIINIFRIIYYVVKARIWMRHPKRHTEEERYALANEMVTKMNRSSGYRTTAYGQENLPKEGGYILSTSQLLGKSTEIFSASRPLEHVT